MVVAGDKVNFPGVAGKVADAGLGMILMSCAQTAVPIQSDNVKMTNLIRRNLLQVYKKGRL
jgi:hypothetical protein